MTKPETIACLSIRQPWASLYAVGINPVENRTWECRYRGRLLVHAGRTWGEDEEAAYQKLFAIAMLMRDARRQAVLYRSRKLLGGFVGVCTVRLCMHEDEWYQNGGLPFDGRREWFTGPYGLFATGARHFPQLVPWRGQQGLFRVSVDAVPYLSIPEYQVTEVKR